MKRYTTTPQEQETIIKIARRAVALGKRSGNNLDMLDIVLDLRACHASACALDLEKLLKADDFTFAHDVFGIMMHMDRNTGKLLDCFIPRLAA